MPILRNLVAMKNLILLLFFSAIVYGQNVQGRVFDASTNAPLKGVHVYINNNKGTHTDKNGKFKLKLNIRANDSIYFSHVGFQAKRISITEFKQNSVVFLTSKRVDLEEVSLKKVKLNSRIAYEKLASMPKRLHNFSAVLVGNDIFVFGGDLSEYSDGIVKAFNDDPSLDYRLDNDFERIMKRASTKAYSNESYNKSLFVYNLDSNTWEISKSKLNKRAYHQAVYDKKREKVYVLGGKRLSGNARYEYLANDVEIFNLNNDQVKLDETNPHQAINFASFIYKDRLLVFGGAIKQQKQNGAKVFSDKISFLNLKTGLWYNVTKMPVAKETSGVLIGDLVYFIGGNNGKPLKTIETFNLITGKWKILGNLFDATSKPALTYHNDTIFIYNEGKILTLNIKTHTLREYYISLINTKSNIFYSNERLYIIGGLEDKKYSREPLNTLVSFDIKEFAKTKVKNEKKLGQISN